MFPQRSTFRTMWLLVVVLMLVSPILASEHIIKVAPEALKKASLSLRNELEVLREVDSEILAKCESSILEMLEAEGLSYESIQEYDYHRTDLPLREKGGIPMAVLVDRGNQGIAGWHNGVAVAGDVLAYMELNVNGQKPGFTFWDMKKDSTWHHYIDTDLDNDEPLFMEASDNKIYYTFHFNNPAIHNSDMRYYWYDVNTGEHGEVENFGYGFEGFGVSDTWMMRVGNKGMGWNNQIFAHNLETGVRFEILADSIQGSWGYNYDNFGGPKTHGNTVIYTYVDYDTYTPDLVVRSLGADGEFGTADDIVGTLSRTGTGYTATSFGQYRVSGRYIVWVERTATDDGNIRAYDMGEDELYGTDDDAGIIDVCLNTFKQSTVRVENSTVIWMDDRNSAGMGEYDIYGYDLESDTEYQLSRSADSLTLTDIHGKNAVLVKPDWDESNSFNDIYFMNLTGRIQSEYFHIDVKTIDHPIATSYLTGDVDVAPYYLTKIVAAGKSPLGAVFVCDLASGNDVIVSYSAVTGEWSSELLPFPANDYTVTMDHDNGLIIGRTSSGYVFWTFNGVSGTFSTKKTFSVRPTGFAIGKNIALVWTDEDRTHYLHTYDADLDSWSTQSATTNDPWHVITTDFSDSLAVLVHGEGDTLCSHVNIETYDLELHDWVALDYLKSYLRQLNRHTFRDDLKIAVNDHFAVAAQEYDTYYDYIYTYSTGDDDWKVKTTGSGYDLDRPILGKNFIVQGCRSGDMWQGYIYNNISGEWLPEYIESRSGIDGLHIFSDLMVAWKNNKPYSANVWAYSSSSNGIQQLNTPHPGDYFTVVASSEAAYVYEYGDTYVNNKLHVFNGIKGEWKDPLLVSPYNQFEISANGHTGIFLERVGQTNGTNEWKAHGYSALRDEWDVLEFRSNEVDGIFTSDFCGLAAYNHYYHGNKQIHAFNGIEATWSKDVIQMYPTLWTGLDMNDRIMMVIEDNPADYVHAKVHVFSPILDMWNTMTFDTPYSKTVDGYATTPTSAFVWNNDQFRIIFSTQTAWDMKYGKLEELHVTDYAIAATLYTTSYTTHYFYPPRTEIINEFEITDGPNVNIISSWVAEVTWKTNMYADTRLIWAVDGYYGIIEKDTLPEQYTKDHRILIEGLEANKTYYYGAVSIITGVDTAHSDTLDFNTGADNSPPALTGPPEAYRIHNNEASVWWETNEPSTAIICWGLTTAYTDTLSYNGSPYLTNAIRMYDLIEDTIYHYQVGGYDRYGNGPFYSGDYTFRTSNPLPVVTGLTEADSTLYGAAYMTWEPPRLDSMMTKETFNNGIPVDWKIYNLGDNKKGSSWTSGYSGNNPVAYCNYGEAGERQEEWLVTNPITIDGTTGGVLNFWHYGFYTEYDNAPNKVMISWTGTDPADFSTIWSSQNLPNGWALEQIDLNYSTNYGKTFYLAFVYESTYGETWMIDNIYMDFDVDGYYENFTFDSDFWTQWSKAPMPSGFGIKPNGGNECIGVDSYDTAPDTYQEEDSWVFSPFIKITESHHLLGFWQMGSWSAMDNAPNEVRIATMVSTDEASSTVVRSIFPVPEGWQWVTVDLSQYIGQTIKVAFRYHSYVGWLWNGLDWADWYGETWYIDDMYLFENAPAMIEDPKALPNEKPIKFASSPDGQRISRDEFTLINSVEADKNMLASEAPEGRPNLPKKRPLLALKLPEVLSEPAPSELAQPKPQLIGYEVYGRFENDQHAVYKGYVSSPNFVDWNTYLGAECEYYVEAVYDQGNSQPSNKAIITGGTKYAKNEYGYDTGILYYSYWWYPGCSMANEFLFGDSVLNLEKIKVHIAKPGSFKIKLNVLNGDAYSTVFTSNTITANEEGWNTVILPIPTSSSSFVSSNEIFVEFLPQDTLVQISYDKVDGHVSWINDGSDWSPTSDVFFIRLIGTKGPLVAIENIPEEFKLTQNYPNPFNPTTTIAFDIPEASDVDIKIYDIRGTLVKTLASGHRDAGRYHMIWNATNMNGVDVASGVYLIKMTAGDYVETRKMVLVR